MRAFIVKRYCLLLEDIIFPIQSINLRCLLPFIHAQPQRIKQRILLARVQSHTNRSDLEWLLIVQQRVEPQPLHSKTNLKDLEFPSSRCDHNYLRLSIHRDIMT